MRKPACMTPSDPPHPKVMRGARPLRAAAEAAEACSEVVGRPDGRGVRSRGYGIHVSE